MTRVGAWAALRILDVAMWLSPDTVLRYVDNNFAVTMIDVDEWFASWHDAGHPRGRFMWREDP